MHGDTGSFRTPSSPLGLRPQMASSNSFTRVASVADNTSFRTEQARRIASTVENHCRAGVFLCFKNPRYASREYWRQHKCRSCHIKGICGNLTIAAGDEIADGRPADRNRPSIYEIGGDDLLYSTLVLEGVDFKFWRPAGRTVSKGLVHQYTVYYSDGPTEIGLRIEMADFIWPTARPPKSDFISD